MKTATTVRTATAVRIAWYEFARDLWREPSGRFDIHYAHGKRRYVAVDADTGTVGRFGTLGAAQAWCGERT